MNRKNRGLSPVVAATGAGTLTDQYLKDRAAMLSWKLQFDINSAPSNQSFYQEAA